MVCKYFLLFHFVYFLCEKAERWRIDAFDNPLENELGLLIANAMWSNDILWPPRMDHKKLWGFHVGLLGQSPEPRTSPRKHSYPEMPHQGGHMEPNLLAHPDIE